ncbi:MAG: amidohydrolase family protein [Elusimicrobia bacterium]|nr:amidohydrolase family protein [Elusimicrobiota bacterium]
MFIDIHVHVRKILGFPSGKVQSYNTPEQLIERYDKIGIESAVMLPNVSPECEIVPQSNEEVIEISKQYPGRFIPFCNIDPRAMTNSADAPLGDILRFYKDKGCKGIGEVLANLPFNNPLVQNLFKHVEQVGFPLTFHIAHQIGNTYGLYDDPGLPLLEQSLQLFPKLKFLGHSAAFWSEIAFLETPGDRFGYPNYPVKEEGVVPKLMRRYPNMLGDLSAGSGYNALSRDPDYAVKFLNEFQDRLYFGTDICTPLTHTKLVDFLLKLRSEKKISETVFQKVAKENAKKLLGLG